MSLISVFYLLFLFSVVAVNYALPERFRTIWLLAAGYFFYLTWQPAFLAVLLGISLWSFAVGGKIESAFDPAEKKRWLVAGIVVSLLPLVFFKYFNFLSDNLGQLAGFLGFHYETAHQPYLVPLGISFFTFLAISYLVDIYRGYLPAEKKITRYFLYLAFFPTLLAGPIERAKSMLGQFAEPVSFDYQNIRAGLQLILWGVFKKVVLADRMTDFMDRVYADPQNFQGVLIYFAIVFSVFQLFCDFSAYSDIAVGSARLLGIRLSKNFDDRVYAAPSRETFWRGWHRSLTSWLRDYVYFPLSRGVKKRARMYFNLIVVYFLVGLWHGATWGFIIWGILNGIWLVFENITKKRRLELFSRLGFDTDGRAYYFIGWLATFHISLFFVVFFRADSPGAAVDLIGNLANSNAGLLTGWEARTCLLTIVFLFLMDLVNRRIPKNENFDAFIGRQNVWLRWAFYVLLAQMILRYSYVFEDVKFLYFNF